MSTLAIFQAIKAALAEIPLYDDTEGDGEKLFEAVELYPNQQLGRALQALILTKKRVCLVVPLRIGRVTSDESGAISVTGRKVAEVAILFSDQAFFKPETAVTFGSDRNLGLFTFDEKIEAALTGAEISPFGAIVLGDSDPISLTESEQRDAPGRQAWVVQAMVPIGLISAETF